jgi:hypothetical protein
VTLVHSGNWVNASGIDAECTLCHGRLDEGGWLNVTLMAVACSTSLRNPDNEGERVAAQLSSRREADESERREAWPF